MKCIYMDGFLKYSHICWAIIIEFIFITFEVHKYNRVYGQQILCLLGRGVINNKCAAQWDCLVEEPLINLTYLMY